MPGWLYSARNSSSLIPFILQCCTSERFRSRPQTRGTAIRDDPIHSICWVSTSCHFQQRATEASHPDTSLCKCPRKHFLLSNGIQILILVCRNMFLNKIGKPSLYLPACMLLWGMISVLTGVTTSFVGALMTRFFLGFVEAAFLPGSLFLLSKVRTRHPSAIS